MFSCVAGALKPSLVEWKLIRRSSTKTISSDLETFLGGMETTVGDGRGGSSRPLETFLGGMETGFLQWPHAACSPLNPSLVEWKHSPPSAERISGSALKPS